MDSFASELDEAVIPSPGFRQAYENVSEAFHMRTDAGRRIFLNLFLSDIVLLPAFNNYLRIFPEIEMPVESEGPKKRKLNGKTDYTVGFGQNIDIFDNTPPRELHLVAIEAKNSSFDEDDLWQCVAETATLYKSRKDAGKAKCAVWGVLSNATDWKFIHIDEDGKLWRSEKYLLNLRSYNRSKYCLFTDSFIMLSSAAMNPQHQISLFKIVKTDDPNVYSRVSSFGGKQILPYRFVRIAHGDGSRTEKYESEYLPNIDSNKPKFTLSKNQLVARQI